MNTIKFDSKNAKVIAHRGLSGIEKQNTCPAFVAAGNRSYFGIETDIHVTKDGMLIVMHDENVKHITDGEYDIDIEKSNYSDVSSILLPDIDGSKIRQDIRIPLLREYIKICKKYNKVSVLELKNHFLVSDLKKVINEFYSFDYLDSVIFISFDLENCINLRKLLPKAKIQYLTFKEITEETIAVLVNNNLDLDAEYYLLTKEIVDKLHSLKIEVNCWTCDDRETAEKLADMGVDYITSNILEQAN